MTTGQSRSVPAAPPESAPPFTLDAERPVPVLLGRWARVQPDATFCVEVDGRSLSYAGFAAEAGAWTRALAAAGAAQGDVVLTMLPTSCDSLVVWMGIAGLRCEVTGSAAFLAAGDESFRPEGEPARHDVSCVIYTSGTTGPSKGVLVPWAQLAATMPAEWGTGAGTAEAQYVPLPMYHVAGRTCSAGRAGQTTPTTRLARS